MGIQNHMCWTLKAPPLQPPPLSRGERGSRASRWATSTWGRLMNTHKTVRKPQKAVCNRVYTAGQRVTSREVGTEGRVGGGMTRSCLGSPGEVDAFQPNRPSQAPRKATVTKPSGQRLCGHKQDYEDGDTHKRVNPEAPGQVCLSWGYLSNQL